MERNDERTIHRLLTANEDWRPDADRGLARLREQRASKSARRRQGALTAGVEVEVCI